MAEEYEENCMIALLPKDCYWSKVKVPHLTLVFGGPISDLKPTAFNEMAKDAASIAMLSGPISLKTKEVEVFGDEEPVDVLVLQPSPEILAMRNFVDHWNKSEYPFSPHVTLGPVGTAVLQNDLPFYVFFDRITVGWGEDYLTFWMGGARHV